MVTRISAAVAASIASGGTEKLGFLNDIIEQLWDHINIIAGDMTKEIVEPMFKEMLPGPLSKLKFAKIDLGKKPIVLDRIDVHSRTDEVLKIDVDLLWDGECDIELTSPVASFGVESIKLAGRVSLLLTPLLDKLPLVAAMQLGFINPPDIRINFTGLAEIAEFGLIEKTVYKIMDNILAGMLVLPNRILVKVDPTTNWYDAFQPDLGVIRLIVEKGYGFTTPKGLLKDIPDIYARVRLGANKEWKTEVINNSVTPEWNDSRDILLSDHDQQITVKCLDSDFANADDSLGDGHISVGKLLLEDNYSTSLPLKIDNVDSGAHVDIRCEVFDFSSDLSSFEAEEFSSENVLCGVLYILIAGVKYLPVEREKASSSVKVSAFDQSFQTMVVTYQPTALGIDFLNPSYDAGFRVPLTQSMVSDPTDIKLTLMNKREKLGTVSIPFEDIKSAESCILTKEAHLDSGAVVLTQMVLKGLIPAPTA